MNLQPTNYVSGKMNSNQCKQWIINNSGKWSVISAYFNPQGLANELVQRPDIPAKAANIRYWKRQFKMGIKNFQEEYGLCTDIQFSDKAVVREFSLEIPGTSFCEGAIRFTIVEDQNKIVYSEETGD